MRLQAMHLMGFLLSISSVTYAGYICPSSASFRCCQALSGGTLSNCSSICISHSASPGVREDLVSVKYKCRSNIHQVSTRPVRPAAAVPTFIPLAAMARAVVSPRIAPTHVLVRSSTPAPVQAVRSGVAIDVGPWTRWNYKYRVEFRISPLMQRL